MKATLLFSILFQGNIKINQGLNFHLKKDIILMVIHMFIIQMKDFMMIRITKRMKKR
jgi:hypothetical protein